MGKLCPKSTKSPEKRPFSTLKNQKDQIDSNEKPDLIIPHA